MAYCKTNINEELEKAEKGKKTRVPVGILLYNALRDYPAIQRKIAAAFSITEEYVR